MTTHIEHDQFVDESISKAHLAAGGWEMEGFNHGNPLHSHMFYLRDYRTQRTQLFCVSQDDWYEFVPHQFTFDMATACLAHLMLKFEEGSLEAKEEATLVAALKVYAKGTGCYRVWCQTAKGSDRLHFLVNIYPETGDDGLLRPFICRSPDIVMHNSEVLRATSEARKQDELRHTEWFKRKKIGGRR